MCAISRSTGQSRIITVRTLFLATPAPAPDEAQGHSHDRTSGTNVWQPNAGSAAGVIQAFSALMVVRICVVSILRFFVIDPFMIVFPTVFVSDLSDDLSFV